MTRVTWILSAVLTSFFATGPAARAAHQAPDPQEVYEVIRTNFPDLTDARLQTAAVEGLVKELQPRVWLVGGELTNPAAVPLLSRSSVFDGPVAYFRVGRVGDGLAQELQSACAGLSRTNQLQGLVLDLRFAGGEDYAAAALAADLFVAKEQPLLDWGAGSAKATEKTNAIRLPIAVLVNRQTAAAAEALAAVLRDTGVAVVIGTNTAGRAVIAQDFPLKNGQHLRIAKAGVKLGSGTALSTGGIRPDIELAVSAADEEAYWADPFKSLSGMNLVPAGLSGNTNNAAGATNRAPRRRMNEAELVRERRDGIDLSSVSGAQARAMEPDTPMVRDPALARALDLIKGLAVVRQLRER